MLDYKEQRELIEKAKKSREIVIFTRIMWGVIGAILLLGLILMLAIKDGELKLTIVLAIVGAVSMVGTLMGLKRSEKINRIVAYEAGKGTPTEQGEGTEQKSATVPSPVEQASAPSAASQQPMLFVEEIEKRDKADRLVGINRRRNLLHFLSFAALAICGLGLLFLPIGHLLDIDEFGFTTLDGIKKFREAISENEGPLNILNLVIYIAFAVGALLSVIEFVMMGYRAFLSNSEQKIRDGVKGNGKTGLLNQRTPTVKRELDNYLIFSVILIVCLWWLPISLLSSLQDVLEPNYGLLTVYALLCVGALCCEVINVVNAFKNKEDYNEMLAMVGWRN